MKRRNPKTQQKSEDRIVSQGPRKSASTRKAKRTRQSHTGREKAVPVKEASRQLHLPFATAENPRSLHGTEGAIDRKRSGSKARKVPKAKDKRITVGSARMEEVVECLEVAFDKVAANKGAPGLDKQTIETVRKDLPSVLPRLTAALLNGSYSPGDVKRVWIPKAGGGQRGLGIPNVIDRMVQEAVRMALEPMYEPTFHPSSHGFRPYRSCHTAIAEAKGYVEEGYTWLVDIDLEKFFDQVHHQRLMSRLAQRVTDERVLTLIRRMLKADVVMPDGVKVRTEEGVPQGGPLSPLLSNIVLSELDAEIARRGHRFVRYADDCNIYVRSERAGQRVMRSLGKFIERRLRLKVNASKSAVARSGSRHFLGFRIQPPEEDDEEPEILLSERSEQRLRERIRELTPRNRGQSLSSIIERINVSLAGWFGYFRICTGGVERFLRRVDAHLRRRLRAIVLKQWKKRRTIARRLIQLGVRRKTAWHRVYAGHKGLWHLSHDSAVDTGLRNKYFFERGLVPLLDRFASVWAAVRAPRQLQLPWDTARS